MGTEKLKVINLFAGPGALLSQITKSIQYLDPLK